MIKQFSRSPLLALGAALVIGVALALTACTSSHAHLTPTASMSASPSVSARNTAAPSSLTSVWKKPGSVLVTALPLGDESVSTKQAAVGTLFSCSAGNASLGGAEVDGPWIHGKTWNATEKVAVAGSHSWPTANISVKVIGNKRVVTTNDLPTTQQTGTFPIAASDPAYQYDHNPNSIGTSHTTSVLLAVTPTEAATPGCLGGGAIAVLLNGVFMFNALDGPGRDAVAHEAQDLCQGHPEKSSEYHYHEVPTCIRDNSPATSTIVGWAYDGYPLVVERDAAGNLPNNADLDACHGRTSAVMENGENTVRYHYSATLEFPYSIGCFHGTPIKSKS